MTIETAVINGSESYCIANFFEVDGITPYTPLSLTYQVDDLTNGVNVVPPTVVAIPAPTVTITLTSTQNTMNAASGGIERRQVMLKVRIPGGTFRNDVVQYRLVRKTGTP